MHTLGFTNQYYTLWTVSEPFIKYGRGEVINGVFRGECELAVTTTYMQNLSMDYDTAIEKITQISNGVFKEDLTLKGEHGWKYDTCLKRYTTFEVYQFSFGKLLGTDIRTCDDVWQLRRAMNDEPNIRTRVYARRRLIELGELILHPREPNANDITIKYISKDQYARIQIAEKSKWLHNEGEKVTLEIKKISSTGYESQYGWVFIVTYESIDENIYMYKGSSPPYLNQEGYTKVSATIKHNEYKGVKQTLLQRIKLI